MQENSIVLDSQPGFRLNHNCHTIVTVTRDRCGRFVLVSRGVRPRPERNRPRDLVVVQGLVSDWSYLVASYFI